MVTSGALQQWQRLRADRAWTCRRASGALAPPPPTILTPRWLPNSDWSATVRFYNWNSETRPVQSCDTRPDMRRLIVSGIGGLVWPTPPRRALPTYYSGPQTAGKRLGCVYVLPLVAGPAMSDRSCGATPAPSKGSLIECVRRVCWLESVFYSPRGRFWWWFWTSSCDNSLPDRPYARHRGGWGTIDAATPSQETLGAGVGRGGNSMRLKSTGESGP